MLTLRHVSKTFQPGTVNERLALDDVSLTFEGGEFATIIGSNGAGKSTLFSAIVGAFWPDKGSIVLDGKNITHWQEHKRARRIGILFQNPSRGTAPNLTIEENLSLAYRQGKGNVLAPAVSKGDRAFLRDKLAAFDMGLEDRMQSKVGVLSGGQRQAMALLMATVGDPRLLLLDEHTAALDPATAEKVLKMTLDIVAEKKLTTLMITHNMRSALALGTRTLRMEQGQVLLDIQGEEREQMTVDSLLSLYHVKRGESLANDRMLMA